MNEAVRKTLAEAVANSNSSLAELSRGAGRNHAYLQQFIERGVPRKLPEDVRMHVAQALGIDETELGAPKRAEPRRLSEAEEWQEEARELAARSTDRAYDPDGWKPKIRGAIPEIDVTLGAGEGAVGELLTLQLGDEAYSGHKIIGEWLFPEEYLRSEINASASKTMVMPVKGDSMEPTYRPGDRVLVDLSQKTLTEDTVYVISDGQSAPRIKRLVEVLFSKPRRVKIVSDNTAIGEQEVDLADLTIIGRVVGVVARR